MTGDRLSGRGNTKGLKLAKIVLGIGTSHGPQLSTPPNEWGQRVEADRNRPDHPFRESTYTFDELVALRAGENLSSEITLDVWEKKYDACMTAIERLAEVFHAVKPDVAIIMGNDQRELFQEDNNPAFCVFHGDKIVHRPATEVQVASMPPGIAVSMGGYSPPEDREYDGVPDLGDHMVRCLMENGFDVGVSNKVPTAAARNSGIPHAFGFVYRQIMKDAVVPNVPLFQNTFFPPNQPTAKRCFEFGQAVHAAIESWESDKTVAVIASGGLSHFVIDAELDRRVLDAMQRNDFEELTAIPEVLYQSGTSETKNWIGAAGILAASGLKMALVDYIPCYRSEGGTGTAMAFATWR